MFEILSLLDVSVVIAGTAFSLKQGGSVQSDIGKGRVAEYLTGFKVMESEDVKTYISQYLNLSHCSTDINIKNWEYLIGRPRLAARLVVEIISAEQGINAKQDQVIEKQDVLKTAVNMTVQVIRKAMEEHLEKIAAEAYEKDDYSNHPSR